MARPTKLTPALQKKILRMVRAGGRPEEAAVASGITSRTFFDWRKRAEAETERRRLKPRARGFANEEIFVELFLEIKSARAEAALLANKGIQQAGKDGKWQALAWWLERHMPEHYAQKVREEQVDGDVVVVLKRKGDGNHS